MNSTKTDRTVTEIEDLLNQIEEINGAKARLKEVNVSFVFLLR